MAARHHQILAYATTLVFAFPLPVTAGLSWQDSWSVLSPDGRYLLVMRQSNSELANPANTEGIELEKKFSESGVYLRGDHEDTLYWALQYQPPVFDAYLTRDGKHLLLAIAAGHMSSNVSPWGELHFFHKEGEPQHWREYEFTWGYLIKELLYIYSQRSWGKWTDAAYDPATNTFTVETNRAEEFVFDVTTGRKIRTSSHWDRWALILLLGIPVLIFGSRQIVGRTPQSNANARCWRVSMAETLLPVTIVAMLLALTRFSLVISIAVLLMGLGGGAVAQIVGRSRRAWWFGGIASIYGSLVGLILFGVLVEPMLLKIQSLSGSIFITIIVGLFAVGGIAGALVGGLLAKERRCADVAADEFDRLSEPAGGTRIAARFKSSRG
ncbi:MAG: hypothetical protein AB7G28_25585 [Pirellulales bacterium]